MEKINAVITGVGGYVPDYILTNDEISKMVDTNDEWIMTRIGVKERHILNEEGLGSSYMASTIDKYSCVSLYLIEPKNRCIISCSGASILELSILMYISPL